MDVLLDALKAEKIAYTRIEASELEAPVIYTRAYFGGKPTALHRAAKAAGYRVWMVGKHIEHGYYVRLLKVNR